MNRVRALGVGMLVLLLAPGTAIGQPPGGSPPSTAKCEVAGYSVVVGAVSQAMPQFAIAVPPDTAQIMLQFDIVPKESPGSDLLLGIAPQMTFSGLKEDRDARSRREEAGPRGLPTLLAERLEPNWPAGGGVGPAGVATAPPIAAHRLTHSLTVVLPDGGMPSEIPALEGELMVGQLEEAHFVFAGKDLRAGTELKQHGLDVRLYCFDADGEATLVGVRLRGSADVMRETIFDRFTAAGGFMRPGAMFGNFGGHRQGAGSRWTLETTDGGKISARVAGHHASGDGRKTTSVRMTADFGPLDGKTPKSLTLTTTRFDGKWRRIPFTVERVPVLDGPGVSGPGAATPLPGNGPRRPAKNP